MMKNLQRSKGVISKKKGLSSICHAERLYGCSSNDYNARLRLLTFIQFTFVPALLSFSGNYLVEPIENNKMHWEPRLGLVHKIKINNMSKHHHKSL